jgi:hypothetical protein
MHNALMEGAGTSDWGRLAEYVARRRNELGLTQGEVYAAGGPSVATMRMIEGALQAGYRGNILGRLEQALQWRSGSVQAVLAGGEPAPSDRPAGEPTKPLPPEVRRWLAIMADPDVPPETKRRMRLQMRLWVEQVDEDPVSQTPDRQAIG